MKYFMIEQCFTAKCSFFYETFILNVVITFQIHNYVLNIFDYIFKLKP